MSSSEAPPMELSSKDLRDLFQKWDVNSDGLLSRDEVQKGLVSLGLPVTSEFLERYLDTRWGELDQNRDDKLSREEVKQGLKLEDFSHLVKRREEDLWKLFSSIDTNHSGGIDKEELKVALQKLDMAYDTRTVDVLFARLDTDKNGYIDFSEFRSVLVHVPDASMEAILSYWQRAAMVDIDLEGGATIPVHPEKHLSKHEGLINSFAGGMGAILSKTSTAPIERLKVLFQQYTTNPPSMIGTLKNIYRHEGIKVILVDIDPIVMLTISPRDCFVEIWPT